MATITKEEFFQKASAITTQLEELAQQANDAEFEFGIVFSALCKKEGDRLGGSLMAQGAKEDVARCIYAIYNAAPDLEKAVIDVRNNQQ